MAGARQRAPERRPGEDAVSDGLPSAEQQELIEEFGLVFEVHGMPRMAGRVVGRLLMCWPPHQSMTHLAEALQASKASISTTTAMLVQMGFVERLTFPGDRQDYFRVRPTSTAIHVQEMARRLRAQLALVERGLAVADSQTTEGLARLVQARDLFGFMARELPALLERWEQTRAAATADPERQT
jgi:DNA-binding transcriptional regulator GbsR (MarR family)